MTRFLFALILTALCHTSIFAQPSCETDETEVLIIILTDIYGYETSWQLTDVFTETTYASVPVETYANETLYQTQVCIPQDACVQFSLFDSFGDGISEPGYYSILVNGDTLETEADFDFASTTTFNCASGQVCENATPVGPGTHTATFDDTWYSFTPDTSGNYMILTCNINDCNTEIWVYEDCPEVIEEDDTGTLFYNNYGCSPQAFLTEGFLAGTTYFIRIGDQEDNCTDAINWELVFLGPIAGCTDTSSCNYNPLATIDDGSCLYGAVEVTVTIRTDPYGYETAWSLVGNSGTEYASVDYWTYDNNTIYETTVCVPADECITFTIWDSYGDGIFAPGYYRISMEGEILTTGGSFGSIDYFTFNCEEGESCATATPISEGFHTTLHDDHWYVFVPDSTGTYNISTCDSNSCDTKIWVYDNCGDEGVDDNSGTIFYDDNQTACAPQAAVTAYLGEGLTYYIRIGDAMDACPDSVNWTLTYLGPVVGCMDPTACNYNPLATIDDGSCIQQGDPECPNSPDLLIRQDVLETSIYLDTINNNSQCLIEEGCLHGYGLRDIIRFSTRIDNIGESDYFIGTPSLDNEQFTFDNCHNHFHYDGYAEYVLFDSDGTLYPIGFKNGFCVLDLGCTTGSPQYGCSNMGISAGCYDEYWSALSCQWIDVTDVPDGDYLFVTRVNWDNAPDALGQVEKDTINNWAQVCINLDRSSDTLAFSLVLDCDPFVDCAGIPYGSTQPDCEGVCGGTTLMGDLDANGAQEMYDAESYVTHVLDGELEATTCNDLNADGNLTVYDAALMASCINYGINHVHPDTGPHDHCVFPAGLTNPMDTVTLTILDANFEENYLDIGMLTPNARINAYQFQMSGLNIMSVESLVDPATYPMAPQASITDAMVVGISYQDSMIQKSSEFQPLCRLYFMEDTTEWLCIESIIDIVNQNYEKVVTQIEDGCVMRLVDNVNEFVQDFKVQIIPNPFANSTRFVFSNPTQEEYELRITDINGKILRHYGNIRNNEVLIHSGDLPSGMYFYQLKNKKGIATGKLAIQR